MLGWANRLPSSNRNRDEEPVRSHVHKAHQLSDPVGGRFSRMILKWAISEDGQGPSLPPGHHP